MVVADSGPIIHLARVGRLTLIRQVFGIAAIPPSVYQETVTEAKAARERGVAAIEEAIGEAWIRLVRLSEEEAKFVRKMAEAEGIEQEDAEVIYLAKKSATTLLTNDKIMVTAANALGVATAWTTTVLLMAVEKSVLRKKEAKALLRSLVSSGLRLRADIYDELLRAIDEVG